MMHRFAQFAITIAAAAALLAACSSGSQSQYSPFRFAGKHRTTACPCIYVTNANISVTVYASDATGNIRRRPSRGIASVRKRQALWHHVARRHGQIRNGVCTDALDFC